MTNFFHRGKFKGSFGSLVGIGSRRTLPSESMRTTSPLTSDLKESLSSLGREDCSRSNSFSWEMLIFFSSSTVSGVAGVSPVVAPLSDVVEAGASTGVIDSVTGVASTAVLLSELSGGGAAQDARVHTGVPGLPGCEDILRDRVRRRPRPRGMNKKEKTWMIELSW